MAAIELDGALCPVREFGGRFDAEGVIEGGAEVVRVERGRTRVGRRGIRFADYLTSAYPAAEKQTAEATGPVVAPRRSPCPLWVSGRILPLPPPSRRLSGRTA